MVTASNTSKAKSTRLCGERYISKDEMKRQEEIAEHNKKIVLESSWLSREFKDLSIEDRKIILKKSFKDRKSFKKSNVCLYCGCSSLNEKAAA